MSTQEAPVQWGIIGTSSVAHQFCAQLARLPGSRLAHVAATSMEKAEAFASRYGTVRCSNSVEALLADPEVQIIHIASPTRFHIEHAQAALEAGKSVVCEKPFATDPERFASMSEEAVRRGLFCMEGMWMRFNPLIQTTRDIVRSGKLGNIKHIRAEIGYGRSASRLEDPYRGPVWDFSVYALSLFQFLLGKPDQVIAMTGDSGRGGTVQGTCVWPGVTASLTASIEAEFGNQAEIVGDRGRVILGAPFFCPSIIRTTNPEFSGSRAGDRWARLREALVGKSVSETRFSRTTDSQSGFYFQALEAERCVREKLSESPIVPHADTLEVIHMAQSLCNSR